MLYLQQLPIINGFIFDILVIIGLKSMLWCLVGARLIFIDQTICCNTSAPINIRIAKAWMVGRLQISYEIV